MTCKPPKDLVLPRWGNRSDRKFFTREGWLTPYSLACGYIERRGDDESGARLSLEAPGCYRVCATGRWTRDAGKTYRVLGHARRAFAKLDHNRLNAIAAEGAGE